MTTMTKTDENPPEKSEKESATESDPHHSIEGLSGFTFVEDDPEKLTDITFSARAEFSLTSADTVQDHFHGEGLDPISAIALSSPMIGGIPLALCDEELLGEINSIPDRLAF